MGRLGLAIYLLPTLLPILFTHAFVPPPPPLLLPKKTPAIRTPPCKAATQSEPPQSDNALERFLIYQMAARLATILPDPRPPAKDVTFEQWAVSTKQLLHQPQEGESDDPLLQSAKIASLLEEATPGFLRFLFRTFGGSRLGCELNALLAPYVSKWLVGPARRVEGPVGDETWESTMLVEECRYLKAVDGCRHACVYLCKAPTQQFFQETLGVPVTLTPDFKDNSCRMCFGQVPPASLEEDPVMEATDGVPSLVEAACCGIGGEAAAVGEKDLVCT